MRPTARQSYLAPMLHPAIRLLLVLLLATAASGARADIFRPAYLELTELDAGTYAVLWRVPAPAGLRRPTARPAWPGNVSQATASQAARVNDSWEERYTIRATGGLIGREVGFEGIRGNATDVIVRVERADGTEQLERLDAVAPRFTLNASPGPGEIAWDYLILGIEHILAGLDHLLFVLALLLLVRNLRRLVLTVTAFTVAHSLTLVAASLGWIHVPGAPVEAIIALSIVFVAAEVIHAQQGRASLTAAAPWIVAFAFGLLHGLGFAGALEEVGLPARAIPVALLMFNVGVELGQLLFVSVIAMLGLLLARSRRVSLPAVSRAVSFVIGTVAAFWTIERVVAFVP